MQDPTIGFVYAQNRFKKKTKGECIYHDQIGDLMLPRPNGRPDGSGDQMGDQNSTVTRIREIRLSIRS